MTNNYIELHNISENGVFDVVFILCQVWASFSSFIISRSICSAAESC